MKKTITLVLALAICLAALTACGSSNGAASSAKVSASKAGTSAEASTSAAAEGTQSYTLVKDGVLTMATNASFPPYEYYEGDKIVGIDADIAAAIAQKLGLELQIEDMEFGSIITAVQTGKVDLGLAGMTVDKTRLKNVDFSDSYAKGVQVVIVKENSSVTSLSDLKNKKIGVQLSTTGDQYATKKYGKDNVVEFNKGNDAVMALVQGKVDAVIIDNEPAKSYVKANEGLKILDTKFVTEDYAACISKKNPGLTKAVNEALAELKKDGTLQKIVDKYITAD